MLEVAELGNVADGVLPQVQLAQIGAVAQISQRGNFINAGGCGGTLETGESALTTRWEE